MRAIAVLIVMVSHAGLGALVPGGFGVTIFFFLSGYLITTLMIVEWDRAGRISFRGFYLRRTVRIIPPMVICILATVLLSLCGWLPQRIEYPNLVWDFLFLSNYAPLWNSSSFVPIPLWSLDVEEHFYLLFPMLFVAVMQLGRKYLLGVLLTLLAIALIARVWTLQSGENIDEIYYWSHTRYDSILFGAVLAIFNNPALGTADFFRRSKALFAGSLAAILLTFVLREPFFRETLRYSVQGIALYFVFNYLMRDDGWLSAALSIKPLRVVADYSYTLYLIHVPLLKAAEKVLHNSPSVVQVTVGLAMSFTFAALMHRTVEQPLLQWRRGFQRRFARP